MHSTITLLAKPLPITNLDPLTKISMGPRNGAALVFMIIVPGTSPRLHRRLFALYPQLKLTTRILLPLLHSIRHLISFVLSFSLIIADHRFHAKRVEYAYYLLKIIKNDNITILIIIYEIDI